MRFIRKISKSKIIASVLAIVLILPTVLDVQADEKVKIINDFNIGSGINQFQFSGEWRTGTTNPDQYNNDEHWAVINKGAQNAESYYYTIKFEGEKIELYGNKAPALGEMEISIDGGEPVIVDAYAPSKATKQKIYESATLESGVHTIKVKGTGRGQGSSSNLQIDYAKVFINEVATEGLEITPEKITMKVNDIENISVKVLPEGVAKKDILWESDNPLVATIKSGQVVGVSEGTARIIVTLEDGNYTKICEVEVLPKN